MVFNIDGKNGGTEIEWICKSKKQSEVLLA
jgi:hypothetical protein